MSKEERKKERRMRKKRLQSPMRASALADCLCAAVLSAVMDSSFFSYRSSNYNINRGEEVGGCRKEEKIITKLSSSIVE